MCLYAGITLAPIVLESCSTLKRHDKTSSLQWKTSFWFCFFLWVTSWAILSLQNQKNHHHEWKNNIAQTLHYFVKHSQYATKMPLLFGKVHFPHFGCLHTFHNVTLCWSNWACAWTFFPFFVPKASLSVLSNVLLHLWPCLSMFSSNSLTVWEPAYNIFVLRFQLKKQQFSVALPTP